MEKIKVREARATDAEALVPLLKELGYSVAAAEICRRLLRLKQPFKGNRVLVAASGRLLVGLAVLHVTPVLHRPTNVGRITALVVAGGSQGQGVGRTLVDAAERYFRRLGLKRVEVTSGPLHRRAHSFYEHLGYSNEGIRFAKPLA